MFNLRLFNLRLKAASTALILPALLVVPSAAASSARAAITSSAQTTERNKNTETLSARVPTRRRRRPRPPRTLPPNRVQPGGGLDVAAQSCDPQQLPLTAVVPKENPVLTASEYPTFLFYLSDDPEQINYAEFILLTSDEKEEIYSIQFEPTRAGLVSVSLPKEFQYGLDNNQVYRWYLNVHCAQTEEEAQETSPSIPAVNGWIKRADEDVNQLDEQGLPAVWYDAIAQLASNLANHSSASNPSGTETSPIATHEQNTQQWNNWLEAIGFSQMTQAIDPADSLTRY